MSNQEAMVGEIRKLEDKWPSRFVTRQEMSKFTGGLLNARTMARLDMQGNGPKGRIYLGRKVGYPVRAIIELLIELAAVEYDHKKRVS